MIFVCFCYYDTFRNIVVDCFDDVGDTLLLLLIIMLDQV